MDRVHVLATPGIDRHAAYVAQSRHRDRVDLHYGQDDFADHGRLVHTLSRERGKDMASDYTRAFADRRKIRVPAPMVEKAPPILARDPFVGLDLRPGPLDSPPEGTAPDRTSLLPAAVVRHGRIVTGMRHARGVGDAYTAERTTELAASRASLDAIAPYAARNLESAMSIDTRLTREAAEG